MKSFMLIFMLILYAYDCFLFISTGLDKFTSSLPIYHRARKKQERQTKKELINKWKHYVLFFVT